MFKNKRKRSLSKNGEELFSVAIEPIKFLITKKNSWHEQNSPSNTLNKKRRHTISCLPLHPKEIFLKLITSKFDIKLNQNSENMKSASKKLLLYLHENPKKIPELVNNAVINLVILILSDGEKYLTAQQVKHNIHFYLKLAEKAMKENDHQTAILIKCAIENYNIFRLRLKLNQKEKKIIDELNIKYGTFKDCYAKHLSEFIKVIQDYDKIYDYLPSAMVLHMHSTRNKAYSKCLRRIGKCPSKVTNCTNTIELYKKLFYNKNSLNKDNLTKLYQHIPEKMKIIEKFYQENKLENKSDKNFKSLLFNLSCNVKKTNRNNKDIIKKNTFSSNTRIYLN